MIGLRTQGPSNPFEVDLQDWPVGSAGVSSFEVSSVVQAVVS